MSSLVSQLMQPGGGLMLIPFVRIVVGLLLVLTLSAAALDVARIHMVVLSVLSSGLLISLSFFESEVKKQQQRSGGGSRPEAVAAQSGSNNKTD